MRRLPTQIRRLEMWWRALYATIGGGTFEGDPANDSHVTLIDHIAMNKLDFITCQNVALGATTGNAVLAFTEDHTGLGSLVPSEGNAKSRLNVDMRRGDDLIKVIAGHPTVIKIDVEGFELEVMKGLSEVLANSETALVVEIIDNFLRKAGSSAKHVMEYLSLRGYDAYTFEVASLRWRKALAIKPLDRLPVNCNCDVLFINRKSSQLRGRITNLLKPG